MSKMVRIDDLLSKKLDNLAKSSGKSKRFILEKALEVFEREEFIRKTNREYELLKKNDSNLFKEMKDEFSEWETTLLDGLEDYD